VAGQLLNITILGKDSYNNVNPNNNPPAFFTASFNNTASTFPSTFVGNGTYVIPYTLNLAKPYVLTITYNGIPHSLHPLFFSIFIPSSPIPGTQQQVKGSPFSGLVITPALPDAPSTYAVGAGIVGGTAGVSLPVTVVVRDRFQNNVTAMPATYQLYGSWDKAAAGSNVTFVSQSDGTYGSTFAITTAGTYRLTIALGPNALPISGSPFTVTIAPRTPPPPNSLMN
jgi:hypothetical protein